MRIVVLLLLSVACQQPSTATSSRSQALAEYSPLHQAWSHQWDGSTFYALTVDTSGQVHFTTFPLDPNQPDLTQQTIDETWHIIGANDQEVKSFSVGQLMHAVPFDGMYTWEWNVVETLKSSAAGVYASGSYYNGAVGNVGLSQGFTALFANDGTFHASCPVGGGLRNAIYGEHPSWDLFSLGGNTVGVNPANYQAGAISCSSPGMMLNPMVAGARDWVATDDGNLIGVDVNGRIAGFNPITSAVRWTSSVSADAASRLIAVPHGGVIYSLDGTVVGNDGFVQATGLSDIVSWVSDGVARVWLLSDDNTGWNLRSFDAQNGAGPRIPLPLPFDAAPYGGHARPPLLAADAAHVFFLYDSVSEGTQLATVRISDGAFLGNELLVDPGIPLAVPRGIALGPGGVSLYVLIERTDTPGHTVELRRYDMDADGDGIPDDWETAPILLPSGYLLDLHSRYGLDPNHKDVIVEIDGMAGTPAIDGALPLVTAAFAKAPVGNPDGTPGIRVHFDNDTAEDPIPAEWDWTDGFTNQFCSSTNGGNLRDRWRQVRQAYFGRAADRGSPYWGDIRPVLAKVVHYCLLATSVFDDPQLLGKGEPAGNDLVLFMLTPTLPDRVFPSLDAFHAVSIMHELGHNLGLGHGGDTSINNKPNYASIMNYRFAHDPQFPLDYSNWEAGTLDENAFNELIGFDGESPATTTPQFLRTPSAPPLPLHGPVDVNLDGKFLIVQHHFAHFPCPTPPATLGKYAGWNDWENLSFSLSADPRWSEDTLADDDEPQFWAAAAADNDAWCRSAFATAGSCPCTPNGATRACGISAGTCTQGMQTCSNGAWSACAGASLPTVENCGDGKDNNCDGQIDENQPSGSCTTGTGACQRGGALACDLSGNVTCSATAGMPGTELCGNGIDDDCDGQTDEGFANLGQPCTAGVGPCLRSGTIVCSADKLSAVCSATAGTPSQEICGDGIDQDCDGVADDGCAGAVAPLWPWNTARTGNSTHGARPTLRWMAASNATSYQVQIDNTGLTRTTSSFPSPEWNVLVSTTSWTPTGNLVPAGGLTNNLWWHVRACNSLGCGPWSATRWFHLGANDDFNCDGAGDALATAPNNQNLYEIRSSTIINAVSGTALSGPVAAAGDLDGDGCADGVMGQMRDAGNAGSAMVYYGGPWGINNISRHFPSTGRVSKKLVGDSESNSYYGWSLSQAGDLNGDGYVDLAISEPYHSVSGRAHVGRVFVYYGSANGISSTPLIVDPPASVTAESRFGYAVSSGGDTNGDGFSDIVITAPGMGGYYVLFGGATPSLGGLISAGSTISGSFGQVAAIADIDGDGFGDVMISDPWLSGEGAVYTWWGSIFGPFALFGPNLLHNPDHQSNSGFGLALATGDYNADGKFDLAVGEPYWDSQFIDQGAALIFQWSGSGWVQRGHFSSFPEVNGNYGSAVTWFDNDGDGSDELLVGKSGDSTAGVTAQGALWLNKLDAGANVISKTRLSFSTLAAYSHLGAYDN